MLMANNSAPTILRRLEEGEKEIDTLEIGGEEDVDNTFRNRTRDGKFHLISFRRVHVIAYSILGGFSDSGTVCPRVARGGGEYNG